MELGEIFSDALMYPLQNIKALIIYVILGIILGIATAGTVGAISASVALNNVLAALGSGIIGIIIAVLLGFMIYGYELDIVKYGINREDRGPEIDFIRQFINGVKLFVVYIVYFLIPIIIGAILAIFFQHWLSGLITAILVIIFALAAMMGQCRLAKTEDLGYALSIGEAIGDISKVGPVKLVLFIILSFIIIFLLGLVVSIISKLNPTIGGILMGILGVYATFFIARGTGLLYSGV
ncbi:DUF4013 domain-containing protein [uncultured Methanobrevibacter sp.]|uniref:DUF4013 domain-containing protein n=1 Tax=uncultured Methanobrevibacter sp. TaxID=253161 RepID=UPI0026049CCB|nr:DUF4013 domain-containing protein [uncultured Methanobrevibacter sp.]